MVVNDNVDRDCTTDDNSSGRDTSTTTVRLSDEAHNSWIKPANADWATFFIKCETREWKQRTIDTFKMNGVSTITGHGCGIPVEKSPPFVEYDPHWDNHMNSRRSSLWNQDFPVEISRPQNVNASNSQTKLGNRRKCKDDIFHHCCIFNKIPDLCFYLLVQ